MTTLRIKTSTVQQPLVSVGRNLQGDQLCQYHYQICRPGTDMSEQDRNAYKGRAYFHRAFRYMALVFEYGDVPLVTTIIDVPKQNYRSTKRDAILQMITKDMEFAVQWVPDQKNMNLIGLINKGAAACFWQNVTSP
ncbi:RagB/SusD family nutrient uptake outer membrane protein [Sphingobacterium multivorum]|uniref:RagB/SusD family nutrient uptake outer membrane protein n=1 Tax=Sphingobacterium multivorum TaxID=28454 RepID=UPI001C49BB23|nr:RagB/SusD family nutrient uptake outer membrane protein [Sphingobacterium multivorum]